MSLPKIHLFTGFLGTGKTTAIRSLIPQKPADEKWLIIVNEFGEIGIDGAFPWAKLPAAVSVAAQAAKWQPCSTKCSPNTLPTAS